MVVMHGVLSSSRLQLQGVLSAFHSFTKLLGPTLREVVMTRFRGALTLTGLLAISITLPASSQGISEYAGAQAASATAASAAHKGAQSHASALDSLYGGATDRFKI